MKMQQIVHALEISETGVMISPFSEQYFGCKAQSGERNKETNKETLYAYIQKNSQVRYHFQI